MLTLASPIPSMKTIPFIGFPLTYYGDLALLSISTVTHGNNLVHQNSYFLSTSLPRCFKMLALLNQVDFPSVCCLKSFEGSLVWIPFINRHPCPSPPAHFFAHTPWELAIYVSLRAQIIHDYLWLQWWDVNRNWGPSIILEIVKS